MIWSVLRVLQFDYQSLDHLLNGLSTLDFFAGMLIIFVTLDCSPIGWDDYDFGGSYLYFI